MSNPVHAGIFRAAAMATWLRHSHIAFAYDSREVGPESQVGDCLETALKIVGAKNNRDGILAEFAYLCAKFGDGGKEGPNWFLVKQKLIGVGKEGSPEERLYDVLDVLDNEGTPYTCWFDITEFFGKG